MAMRLNASDVLTLRGGSGSRWVLVGSEMGGPASGFSGLAGVPGSVVAEPFPSMPRFRVPVSRVVRRQSRGGSAHGFDNWGEDKRSAQNALPYFAMGPASGAPLSRLPLSGRC
ncbi:MAG: hypothetical protein CM15mP18_1070 [Methanobacteriota archaeon]|nr:MAG: hypothetical protein CM15mP18_1070 [Euryarchaeota archaeon]